MLFATIERQTKHAARRRVSVQRYVQELAMRRRARDENGDAWYETRTALDTIRSLQAQREPKEGEICEAECLGEPREPTLAKTNLSDP